MQKVFVFLLIICATSCDFFNAKKTSSEDIYNEELKTFNWNAIDSYPTFYVCDTLNTKNEKKECFENTISQHITLSLENEVIIVSQNIKDTLLLEFNISEKGKLNIEQININETTEIEIPNIKKLITNSLTSLPLIYPAIKRNQPVKTKFKMPIIIVVN